MDRLQASDTERFAPMRARRPGAIELLLRADLRERTEPVAPPPARRILHALAVLWQPAYVGAAEARGRLRSQPQTRSTLDGRSRPGGNLSQAASQSAGG